MKGCARGISGRLGRSAANPFQPIPIDGYVHLVNLLRWLGCASPRDRAFLAFNKYDLVYLINVAKPCGFPSFEPFKFGSNPIGDAIFLCQYTSKRNA